MNSTVNRRDFLKNIAALSGVTVVSAALPALAESDTATAVVPTADHVTGYHETPHIRAYYRTLQD
jgi:anaerobic selenocysteine-containing dehydrogenase